MIEIPLPGWSAPALIDDQDASVCSGLRWRVQQNGRNQYAIADATGSRPKIYMHRLIYVVAHGPIPPFLEIDHINANGLDNRRENLRAVTRSENMQNLNRRKTRRRGVTSALVGVYLRSDRKAWVAQARIDGKTRYLGSFETEDAARARYVEAIESTTHKGEGR